MDNQPVDINVVYAFCAAGVRILKIDGRYYKVEFWQEATSTILKHNLKGRDITEKLVNSPAVAGKGAESQLSSVVMDFENIRPRLIDFSKEIPFILYT